MIMAIKSQREIFASFQNLKEDYSEFQGKIISSDVITQHNFEHLNVAIIGTDQFIVMHLENICLAAKNIKVFQISPQYILPKTDKGLHRLISHPLLIKNRRLFSNRIKALLSLRFLESQVIDPWLRRLLTPNSANLPKNILKSDSYYAALQRENCSLNAWPIQKVSTSAIHSIDRLAYFPDIIITTFTQKC
ncbi:flavoprotein [Acinetobacter sp. Ac_877]|uniref:flavoprotein n=1 Tax=Acinetobacter portensis TaxID=1839785 RepID=UPI00128BCAFB|nr:flavoprotein [Acinetobacter portensis]MPW41792.1 flavoprotein [Acinetobacter portensis]